MSDKIRLFNIPRYQIDSRGFEDILYGQRVRDFEQEFAEFVGYKYAVACNSASSIVFLLCKLFRRAYNNFHFEVPTVCPVVVPNMVHLAGCDIGWKIGDDWVGHEYILAKLPGTNAVIWDCAHTVESTVDGYGKIFSFYPTKPVGGIDGGMFCSDDKYIVESLREMATNGAGGPGYKMYMNSMQAEWASRSLKAYPTKRDRLDEIAAMYNAAFGLNNDSRHLYRVVAPVYKDYQASVSRIIQDMELLGIETKQHYKKHPFFTESQSTSRISIPYHDALTQSQIDYVIEKVRPWIQQ